MGNGKSVLIQAVKALREEIHGKVRKQLADESRTYREVAEANGLSIATIQRIATSAGIERQVGPRPKSSTPEVSNGDN
jgi:DNA invertase Pin-like site-specific DNA recombinase